MWHNQYTRYKNIPYIHASYDSTACDSTITDIKNPFLGKPFYCWDTNKQVNDTCCFNHMVGMPVKNRKVYPLFDYNLEMQQEIEQNNNVWIKKAKGIGATTFIIRYLSWKCVVDDLLSGYSIFIIAGTLMDMANEIKVKFENLFPIEFRNIISNSKYTETTINKTKVKIFPTKNIKDMRGRTDVAYLFVDEADFFTKADQRELPFVISTYEEKSNATIIMVSTPNKPDGLFATIEKQSEEECIFKRLFMGYERGLGKIFDPVWIAKKKVQDPIVFEREYNLKYLGGIGNLFTHQMVDIALSLGDQFKDYPETTLVPYHVGVDPGFGSSKTAIVVTQWIPEYYCIKVIYSQEWERPNPNHIVDECFRILEKYQNVYFWVDRSNAGFVTELKTRFDEPLDWMEEDTDYLHPDNMRVIPVNFSTEHKNMLSHLYQKMNKPMVAISRGKIDNVPLGQEFYKLEIALRSAQAKEYSLDKEETSYDDMLDALRLACLGYTNLN